MKFKADQQYSELLKCCTQAVAQDRGDSYLETSRCFFHLGLALSKAGEISGAIRAFTTAFMVRDAHDDLCEDLHWREFHDVQMAIYVLGKHTKRIGSLAEGDMVHDLIKSRYVQVKEELAHSEIPFAGSSLRNWFRTVRIDFPWDPGEPVVGLQWYEDGQFDHDILEELLSCVKITQ